MKNPQLKAAYAESEFTPASIQELYKCAKDPIYFMLNYVKVIHPTKGTVPFELYDYQKEMVKSIHENKDTVILASRQLGKCCQADTIINTARAPIGFRKFILKIVNKVPHSQIKIFDIFKQKIINWCFQSKDKTISEIFRKSNFKAVNIPDQNGKVKFVSEGKSDLLVKTPTGWSAINRTLKTIAFDVWRLELDNGMFLDCADEHLIISENGAIHVSKLNIGDVVLIDGGLAKVKSIIKTSATENMYDLELADNKHEYYTNGILSHNTTVVAMYILWFSLFNENKKCTIASRAMLHATEIMSRIKFAYEELPNWLKAGCKFYNRTSIEFDNGSVIKCEATSEKTGRGDSLAILFIDELAFISKRIQDEMWASVTPSLSTGGKFILTSTPNGDRELFSSVWHGALSGTNSFKPLKVMWYQHPDRGQKYYDEMRGKLGDVRCKQELDCIFLSSDALLIDTRKLSFIRPVAPITENMGFKIWSNEIGGEGKTYLMGVDPATGNGHDFTAIEVVEFPSLKQVMELRMNTMNIPLIYSKINWVLKFLRQPNKAGKKADVVWSFERNGVGEALVAMIQNDDTGAIYLDDGVELYNESDNRLGVYTGGKSKFVGCMQLKNLIEKMENSLVIKSDILHYELENFISINGTYKAKAGATDDTIMAMLVVMKLLNRLATYDDAARKVIYSNVAPDSEQTFSLPPDQFGDEPVPLVF